MALTPCILPLLPILLAVVLESKKRPSLLAGCYVLGMATSYSLLGATLALLGQSLQTWLQTPWVIGPMAGFLMYLSLFLCEYLPAPQFLNHTPKTSTSATRYGYLGVFILGMTSTLTLSPCATPAIMAAMSWVITDASPWYGAMALFTLGLGAGTPMLILATTGKKLWPKSGPWLKWSQHVLGVIVGLIALSLLTHLISWPTMAWIGLVAALLIVCHIWRLTPNATKPWLILSQLSIISIAVVLLWPTDHHKLQFTQITNHHELTAAFKQAASKNQNILLLSTATWCNNCRWLKQHILQQPQVIKALKNWQLLQLDISTMTPAKQQLMQQYQLIAPPSWLIIHPKKPHQVTRHFGTVTAEDLLHWIQ